MVVDLHVEKFPDQGVHREPLVEAHTIDDDEIDAAFFAQDRRDPALQDVRGERGRIVSGKPRGILRLDVLAELDVELSSLVRVRLLEPGVFDLIELHVPLGAPGIEIDPTAPVETPRGVRAEPRQLRHVIARPLALLEPVRFEETLQREENLRRAHRLDQIVVDALPDRLVHERFRFVLRDQHDRDGWVLVLDRFERGKPAEPGHRFVEQDDVELLARGTRDGVISIGDGGDLVALRFQEQDVGLQEVDLVIGPKNFSILERHGSFGSGITRNRGSGKGLRAARRPRSFPGRARIPRSRSFRDDTRERRASQARDPAPTLAASC